MELFGKALLDFSNGNTGAEIVVHRDDGYFDSLPVAAYFSISAADGALDTLALNRCKSPVLDVGAGAGRHSLFLQDGGHDVTALEVSPSAVEVLRRRGIRHVEQADVLSYTGGPFSTLLCLGRTAGFVKTLSEVVPFLQRAMDLLVPGGQILFDSLDVRSNTKPEHIAYRDDRTRTGAYLGEVKIRFEYCGEISPWFGWVHVDPDKLQELTAATDLQCEVLHQQSDGAYLARVTKV